MIGTVIVVPCYNEAARLDTERFAAFAAVQDQAMLLFVDDGSVDETARLLDTLAARVPGHISVLRLKPNGGKANAVRAGALQAVAEGALRVGYWDADLSTPL